ncbi:MAG TPA: zinc ribbon domain-containing protein [Candidatus Dormibacteraeota bacterium]|nr:zinc ribbon domain-containing protein [Candidatus Dormibacteraeota bacterium]
MFCDQCGREAPSEARFCSNCGRNLPAANQPFQPANTPPAYFPVYPPARVNSHLRVLGVLWLISGILQTMSVGWLWFVGRMIVPSILTSITPAFSPGSPLERVILGGIAFASMIIVLQALLSFVAAWGLFERQSWGRLAAIIAGIFALWRIPFGTALGIYTLWVLLPASSEAEYRSLVRA